MPPPIPPVDYFSSEDAPLLSEYPHLHPRSDFHHDSHHGDFDVAVFPETPLLPSISEAHDDDFSDFVQTSLSEIPPNPKSKDQETSSIEPKLSELPSLEYIAHVAVVILVQLLIPIPFMLPMAINFAKRALKVLLPGFMIGLLANSVLAYTSSVPDPRPVGLKFFLAVAQFLPSPSTIPPALFAQAKIAVLGGIVVGAIMAHVLNFVILGHTLCRLVRDLDPEPSAMRRTMDASKTFQVAQRVGLDLLTAVCMMPAGLAARNWCGAIFGVSSSPLPIDTQYSVICGVAGVVGVHGLRLAWHASVTRSRPQDEGLSERQKELLGLKIL